LPYDVEAARVIHFPPRIEGPLVPQFSPFAKPFLLHARPVRRHEASLEQAEELGRVLEEMGERLGG
jgi:hypothetical protein